MKLAPLALAALTLTAATVAAPAPEARAGSRCDALSRAYYANDKAIRAFNLKATHSVVQEQFAIRSEARQLGCPLGGDELQGRRISGTVVNPMGARQTAQKALCSKWEKGAHIAAVNGKPNFAFRIFVEPGDRLTVVERRSETDCRKVVKGTMRVDGVRNGHLYLGNTMVGMLSTKAYRAWGSNRQFHNAWTAGAGARFYK